MDFTFPAETEEWRGELRSFLKAELPERQQGSDDFFDDEEQVPFARELSKKLGAKRWFAPAWPEKYGGLGKARDRADDLQRGDGLRRALPRAAGCSRSASQGRRCW